MRKIFFLSVALLMLLTSCGGTESEQIPEDEPAISEEVPDEEPSQLSEEKPENKYEEIIAMFAPIYSDAEITASLRSNVVHIRIKTDLPAEKPDSWADILGAFESALDTADEAAESYGVFTVSAEFLSSDETIMASGFQGSVKYTMFKEVDIGGESDRNPPTISKFEYDQITVGMSLSEVNDLIGGPGTLQRQIGEAGGYGSLTMTYRWYGEREDSYADILFDDYKVYSKHSLFLD